MTIRNLLVVVFCCASVVPAFAQKQVINHPFWYERGIIPDSYRSAVVLERKDFALDGTNYDENNYMASGLLCRALHQAGVGCGFNDRGVLVTYISLLGKPLRSQPDPRFVTGTAEQNRELTKLVELNRGCFKNGDLTKAAVRTCWRRLPRKR